jgi:hypothetical protein
VLYLSHRHFAANTLHAAVLGLGFAAWFWPFSAGAQQFKPTEWSSSPTPKAQRRNCMIPSLPKLECSSVKLGVIQGGAELYDGMTTRYFVHHCKSCVESDPMSRLLLGSKPTWRNMLIFGSIEAVATTYLHQQMSRSSNRTVRHFAPWIPAAIISVHIAEGTKNLIVIPPTRSRRIQPLP